MAKIVTSFDTQTKEFSVMLDNTEIKNVNSVEFYGLGDNKAYCEVTTTEVAQDKDMIKITRIMAEDSEITYDEVFSDVQEEAKILAKYFRR